MTGPIPCVTAEIASELAQFKQQLMAVILPPVGILLPTAMITAIGVSTGLMNRTLGLAVVMGYAASFSKLVSVLNIDYRDEDLKNVYLDVIGIALNVIGFAIEYTYVYLRCRSMIPHRLRWLSYILICMIPVMSLMVLLFKAIGYGYHYIPRPPLPRTGAYNMTLTDADIADNARPLLFAFTDPRLFQVDKWINEALLSFGIVYNVICSLLIISAIRKVTSNSDMQLVQLNHKVRYVLRSSEIRMIVAVTLGVTELVASTLLLNEFISFLMINVIATLKIVTFMTDSLATLLTPNVAPSRRRAGSDQRRNMRFGSAPKLPPPSPMSSLQSPFDTPRPQSHTEGRGSPAAPPSYRTYGSPAPTRPSRNLMTQIRQSQRSSFGNLELDNLERPSQ